MKFNLPSDRRAPSRPTPGGRPAGRPGPAEPAAADPVAIAAEEVRRHDPDRFATALAAPVPARRGLLAVYAFNLELARTREAVSETMLGEIRLQWWRDSLDELYAGTPKRHMTVLALAECQQRTPLSRAHLDALIDARATDLYDEQIRSPHDLEQYCAGTGGRVAHLALEALGVSDIGAHAAASHVGIAWALVGLIRALPFHAAQRRLYLPLGMLASAGLSPEDVYQGRSTEALHTVLAEVGLVARRHLADARALAPAIPAEARPALLPAVLAGRYLDRLQRRRFDPFGPPVALGPTERPLALALAALRGRY